MCAASDGHAEVVKQLVAHGADVTAKNKVHQNSCPAFCLTAQCVPLGLEQHLFALLYVT